MQRGQEPQHCEETAWRVRFDPGLQTVQEELRQEGHSWRGDAGVQGRHTGVLRRGVWPGPGAGRGKGCWERRRSSEPPRFCVQRQEGRWPNLLPTGATARRPRGLLTPNWLTPKETHCPLPPLSWHMGTEKMESQAALKQAGPAHGQYSDPQRPSQHRTPSGPVVLGAEGTLIRDNVWAPHLPAALPLLPCSWPRPAVSTCITGWRGACLPSLADSNTPKEGCHSLWIELHVCSVS